MLEMIRTHFIFCFFFVCLFVCFFCWLFLFLFFVNRKFFVPFFAYIIALVLTFSSLLVIKTFILLFNSYFWNILDRQTDRWVHNQCFLKSYWGPVCGKLFIFRKTMIVGNQLSCWKQWLLLSALIRCLG